MPVPEVENGLGMEYIYPDTATSLLNLPSMPCIAIIQCALLVDGSGKGNVAVRFLDNGVAPTANLGFELNPGQTYRTTCSLRKLQFIGVAVNARLNVKYEPYPSALTRVY